VLQGLIFVSILANDALSWTLPPDEILERADRIVVVHDGMVAHEMPAEGADPQEIGWHMLGHR
jgi:ABC-type uncharacterized transport system ATPase subunit